MISQKASAIAETYPEESRAEYIQAASTLRLPYWNWDGVEAIIPDIIKRTEFQVNAPNGTQTIKNPIASYRFHPIPRPQDFNYLVSATQLEKFTIYTDMGHSLSFVGRRLSAAQYSESTIMNPLRDQYKAGIHRLE